MATTPELDTTPDRAVAAPPAIAPEAAVASVSFVIPALDEEDVLERCLASIESLARPEWLESLEVVVADNRSTDGTVAVARRHGARVVSVEPGSAARARNAGALAARGDLLAFVDADCELDPDWLIRLGEHFVDGAVLAAGSAMAAPRPDAPWVEACWFELAHRRGSATAEDVAWLASFNLLVRRDAFEAICGFDESLVTCEDADLGYRLSAAGRLVLDPGVETRHHGESRSLREFFRREAWRGRDSARCLRRHAHQRSELRSVLVPIAFAAGCVAGIILALAGIADIRWLGASLAGFGGAGALALLAVLRKKVSLRRLPGCWILMVTYLSARALALVRRAPRVVRRG